MSLTQPPVQNGTTSNDRAGKQSAPAAERHPLAIAHSLLRGRYAVAVILALVFGIAGAVAGYTSVEPVYESKATIRIAPILPKVLYETEDNSMLPMFGGFVETQIALIQSNRVLGMAAASDTWQQATGDLTASAEQFSQKVSVEHQRGSQLLNVVFADHDKSRVRFGAQAVVEAFMQVYGETDQVQEAERLELLRERSEMLTTEIEGLRQQILELANDYGTDALQEMHSFQIRELQSLETELRRARIDLATVEGRAGVGADENELPKPSQMSLEEIAAINIRMQTLLDERNSLQLAIDEILAVYKKPELQSDYKVLKLRLDRKNEEIREYAERFRSNYSPDLGTPKLDEDGGLVVPLDPVRARLTYERLQQLYDDQRAKTLELGRTNLRIENLRTQMARAQTNLDTTNARIQQLNVESAVGGRVKVLSQPDTPTGPSNGHRPRQFAAAGGVGGAGIAVALVMLVGLINPRVRYIADAEDVRPKLLGALPELPEKLVDPADAMIAAQCVHQIRNVLQTTSNSHEGLAVTVTSAASGTGKSSMSLSLGLSLAAAGSRTLLVDADMVGMGLTRLIDSGDHDAPERDQGNGRKEHSDVGETSESVDDALVVLCDDYSPIDEGSNGATNGHLGLAGALHGEPLENCTFDMGVPNLTFLPTCGQLRTPVNILSRREMRAFVEDLRSQYEFVVIDTGPVPGPSDSSIMAAVGDAVLMMVSRGESSGVLRQALAHLDLIGARVVGLVFNRARSRDLESSGHSSTNSSKLSVYSEVARAELVDDFARRHEYARFGPIAQAVWTMSFPHTSIPEIIILD